MTNDFWKTGLSLLDTETWVGAAFLAIVLGLVAWLMGEAVRLVVRQVLEKRGKQADQTGLILLGQLARVGVWLFAFLSYAQLVPALKRLLNPATLVGAAIYAAIVGVVAWLVGGALRLAVHRVLDKRGDSVDQTAVRFLGQLARVGVWLFAFVSYAHLIPALQGMGGAWLTSVGVASVVVGLAAQNTLGNLIAGISLVLYRPFQIGDHLQIAAPGGLETGIVESINLGYTALRTGDERRVVIPNSLMASQTCINLSPSGRRAACVVSILLERDADVDKARQILLDLARNSPKAMGTPACRITGLSSAGVSLTLTAWTASSLTGADLKCDILEGAKKQFDEAGIKIPRDYEIGP